MDSQEYHSFLSSLDDSQLVSHINGLSQSTPKSSDPFDDDLDEVLREMAEPDSDADSDVGPVHQFGQYDVYFRNKHAKQQRADESFVQWDLERRQQDGGEKLPPVFKDCVVFVNGHTQPSMNEIHRLVVLHGGRFISYLPNKSAATHIVCDRLTPRKRIQFRRCRVVKAQWIVDCVAQGRALDWKPYRLISDVDYNQGRLELENRPEDIEFANEQFQQDEVDLDEFDDLVGHNEPVDLHQQRVSNSKSIMDAKHPDFIPHFFSNSRLHHLSTWKADLRLRFLKRVMEAAPRHISSNSPNGKIIFHIDFDCFFATASCQKHPELDLNRDPIAVSHGNNTSDIASCNYPARKFGVKNGMWIRSAKRLCPDLIIIDYAFDLYEKHASEVYNYMISKGDMIDALLPVSVDEMLLDLTSHFASSQNLHADVMELCSQFRRDIYNLTKCTVSIGASSNVLLAKLALRQAKPDGAMFVDKDIQSFLDPLRVKDLPSVGRSLIQKLQSEFNLKTDPILADLRELNKQRLINVFGPKTGDKLYNYARGVDLTSLKIDSKTTPELFGRKTVSVDINFGIRFDKYEQLETFLMRLAEELSKRLVALNLVGSQVSVRLARRAAGAPIDPPKYLGMGLCDFFTKSSKLGVPSNDPGILGAEIKTLCRILGIPIEELRGVAATVSKLEDVDQFKRAKQQKLSFNKRSDRRIKRVLDTSDFKDPIGSQAIDWGVFHELPWDIRRELKSELTRRGMISDRDSPTKGSPTKIAGQKVYLQQLLPSSGGTTNYVRVIESPTKSPSKRQRSVSKSRSPVKQDLRSDEMIHTSVLEELPSSVQAEVRQHQDHIKKMRAFENIEAPEIMPAPVSKTTELIDKEFLLRKGHLETDPSFFHQKFSFEEIKQQIGGWVTMSLKQGGPHDADVAIFLEYLSSLMNLGKLDKCLGLVKCLKREIECVVATQNLAQVSQTTNDAIDDWNKTINTDIHSLIYKFEDANGIKIMY